MRRSRRVNPLDVVGGIICVICVGLLCGALYLVAVGGVMC